MLSIKLLRVIVNERLSWKEQIVPIYKKLRQIFCIIVKIRPNLNEKKLLMLYHFLIISHIRIAYENWCFGNKTLIDKLQRLCNKFIKIIFNLSHKENFSRTMSEHNLITMKHMYSNGFNRVRGVRLHWPPPKIDQKVAPLHKKLLDFYEEALGR